MAKNNLKKTLTQEGVSQAKLSSTSGISIGTINKICNQKRECSATTNHKLLKELNTLTGKQYKYEDVFQNSQKY